MMADQGNHSSVTEKDSGRASRSRVLHNFQQSLLSLEQDFEQRVQEAGEAQEKQPSQESKKCNDGTPEGYRRLDIQELLNPQRTAPR